MALFVIYSDLASDEKEWKATFEDILERKHQICIITTNKVITKRCLSSMGVQDAIQYLEVEKGVYHLDQIKKAKNLTNFTSYANFTTHVILALPNRESLKYFGNKIPDEQILVIKNNEKNIFNFLKKFGKTYKRSSSREFADIRMTKYNIFNELQDNTPTTPRENLQLQLDFLKMTLRYADLFPDQSKYACLLKTKADFEEKRLLENVTKTSIVNIQILGYNLGLFGQTDTPIQDLLKNAEDRVARNNPREEMDDDAEEKWLLSVPHQTYGTMGK